MSFHHNKVFKYIDLQFITKIRTHKVKNEIKNVPPMKYNYYNKPYKCFNAFSVKYR